MTSRERILKILRGEPVDRIAWVPFLSYWWDMNKVKDAEALGEIAFTKAVGADILMRGHRNRPNSREYQDLFMFRLEYGKTKVIETVEGNRKYKTYDMPIGSLRAGYIYSPDGDTWFLDEHPVKTEQDLEILTYIASDSVLTEDFEPYLNEQKENPGALFLPLITPFSKSSFQSMLEFWIGTEQLCYALEDEPEKVERALEAMRNVSREAAKISAASPAEAFISWEDTSTTNISPEWYERYILPEINEWCDILHASGKLYIQHACGHVKDLRHLIASSKIDAIESLSAPPTGNITPWEFAESLPEHIAVISGIEPTFFIDASVEELEKHVDFLCRKFEGKRFVMANADSCPPSVEIEKFGIVSRRLYQYFKLEPPQTLW